MLGWFRLSDALWRTVARPLRGSLISRRGYLDEVHVGRRMNEVPQVPVDLVHAAVLAALRDVQLMAHVVEAPSPFLALPDRRKGLFRDVAVAEPPVLQVGAAPVNIPAGHDIGPEEGGGLADGVPVPVLEQ